MNLKQTVCTCLLFLYTLGRQCTRISGSRSNFLITQTTVYFHRHHVEALGEVWLWQLLLMQIKEMRKSSKEGKLCLCRVKNELAHLISRQPSDLVDSLARSLFICSIYVFFKISHKSINCPQGSNLLPAVRQTVIILYILNIYVRLFFFFPRLQFSFLLTE